MCLVENTGSCVGCNILDLVVQRVNKTGESPAKAAQAVGKVYCPKGLTPQHGAIKPIEGAGMGQSESSSVTVRL